MITNMMKTLVLVMTFATLCSFQVTAQKIAVVDITVVLESIPDYQAAQDALDKQAAKWRQEIAEEYDRIKGMYNKYQAEQVLLSDDARRQREDEIMNRETQVRDLQRRKFGPEGELFQKRQELVQPIQEKVYRSIERFALDRGYDFIFDKSGSAGLIFSNSSFDVTEDVIKRVR
jgi:outer membrane protein